jgi:NhaA family Na+:H+ antiporter
MNNQSNYFISNFFKIESAGGVLLMISATLAILCANSPMQGYYDLLLFTLVEIPVGTFEIAKPLLLCIND